MSNKLKQPIMVVKSDLLFANHHFEGFLPQHEYDYEKRILANYEYLPRGIAEENPKYRQTIPYAIICNENQEIFTYQRTSGDNAGIEERLHGKWSWGVGGHIDQQKKIESNPIYATLLREIFEEIGVTKYRTIKILGYVNNESDSVGRVHFGILYRVNVISPKLIIQKREIDQGRFMSIQEIASINNDDNCIVEEWSQHALKALKIT
ncbi:hypothetical protein DRQ11_10740 [candidate division KSB1 bacterium]|nr:MAG: hypothetical protein DRQ11_10740 [candidate division KSB1 bacterium]